MTATYIMKESECEVLLLGPLGGLLIAVTAGAYLDAVAKNSNRKAKEKARKKAKMKAKMKAKKRKKK